MKLVKALIITLLFGLSLGLSSCSSSPEAHSPVSAWNDEGGSADEVYRIEQALRPGDGITVNMEWKPPARMALGPLTIITYQPNDPIGFSVRDHWLDRLDTDAGDVMLDKANDQHTDRTRRAVYLIKEIHQWQDTHPRPQVTASAPAPVPAVAPAPAPSKPILGPFMHWVSMIVAFLLAVGALFLVTIFGQDLYQAVSKSRAKHRRNAEMALAKHRAEIASITARADWENEQYMRGDRDRGVHGRFPIDESPLPDGVEGQLIADYLTDPERGRK